MNKLMIAAATFAACAAAEAADFQIGVPARKALYVVAAEDPWDESPKVRTISFEGAGKVTAFAANGPVPLRRLADERRYAFDLKSNNAVLVVFEM